MYDSIEALEALCEQALSAGVNRQQIVDLIGKMGATLGNDFDSTKKQVGGSVYELVRVFKILDRNYTIQDPSNVADNLYLKNGTQRARQQKWATGTGNSVMDNNLVSAVKQLAGVVQGNNERAPNNSVAIADLVLVNPPQSVLNTLTNGFGNYALNLVNNVRGKPNSQIPNLTSVSLRVTTIQGALSTKYIADYDVNSGQVVIRQPETKQRDEIIISASMIELLASDVRDHTRATIKNALTALSNRI